MVDTCIMCGSIIPEGRQVCPICAYKVMTIDENTNESVQENDAVNHPAHYTAGSIECIEAIKASMDKAEYRGFLKGQVLKYMWRYENKGRPVEDLSKAEWYLIRLINECKEV